MTLSALRSNSHLTDYLPIRCASDTRAPMAGPFQGLLVPDSLVGLTTAEGRGITLA
jgi:hypothetical protein